MPACTKKDFPMLLLLKNHLEDWEKNRGTSVQLDGQSTYNNNQEKWLTFSFGKKNWKLNGDTKDFAVKKFLDIWLDNNGKDVLFVQGNTLRIKGDDSADGWYCYRT